MTRPQFDRNLTRIFTIFWWDLDSSLQNETSVASKNLFLVIQVGSGLCGDVSLCELLDVFDSDGVDYICFKAPQLVEGSRMVQIQCFGLQLLKRPMAVSCSGRFMATKINASYTHPNHAYALPPITNT